MPYIGKDIIWKHNLFENFVLSYAILIIPFLRVFTPSILLIHWECLSFFIFSSCRTAHCLLLASCLLPGPTWCSLARRHWTCALTAVADKILLICPTIRAFSLSDIRYWCSRVILSVHLMSWSVKEHLYNVLVNSNPPKIMGHRYAFADNNITRFPVNDFYKHYFKNLNWGRVLSEAVARCI